MAAESKLQSEIIAWLKINGVYVIKTRPGAGTPVGCPDIIGLYHQRWIAIEVKASDKAPFQAGQKYTLQLLKEGNSFVYVVCPENWELVKEELTAGFF
jgi:Holliday junction resolvase